MDQPLVHRLWRQLQRRVERQKTSYLAAERFSRNLFGSTNPYGVVFDENSFQAISGNEVQSFHHQAYRLAEAEIFLCGDVEDQHIAQVQAMVGTGNTAYQVQATATGFTAPVASLPHDYVTVADSIQSSIRIGRLWPAPSHPDTHKLQVLAKILGGYFGSRLMKNIREDKGFTYGIYASVGPREHATSFVIGTDVNAASTQATITEVHHELIKLQEEHIPTEELKTVKNYMAGKFANELSTVFEQCDKYKSLVFLNLSTSFYTDFLQDVSSIDAAELQQLAQQYLSPSEMIEVIAGPGAA